MSVILGFDPGLERVGYGVVRRAGSSYVALEYGLIQTPRIELPARLALIGAAAGELIARFEPEAIATERLLFAANKTTAMDVAKGLGAVLAVVGAAKVPWFEYAPPEVKLSVVGAGRADKGQVAFMVTRLLGLTETPKPDDVTDALAIALCHALRGPAIRAQNLAKHPKSESGSRR